MRIHYTSGGKDLLFDEPRDEDQALVDATMVPKSISTWSGDLRVSRRHARISYDSGGWLEDLGSSNGTVLDGQLVQLATRVAL